jgi:hypothetical protein
MSHSRSHGKTQCGLELGRQLNKCWIPIQLFQQNTVFCMRGTRLTHPSHLPAPACHPKSMPHSILDLLIHQLGETNHLHNIIANSLIVWWWNFQNYLLINSEHYVSEVAEESLQQWFDSNMILISVEHNR